MVPAARRLASGIVCGANCRRSPDGGWKRIIKDYLEKFFRLFFTQVHALIDLEAGYTFLDKELAKSMVDTETGDR
ncbi:MAG: hypothetical protein R6U98_22840 [Pirellulaceae bacterium]